MAVGHMLAAAELHLSSGSQVEMMDCTIGMDCRHSGDLAGHIEIELLVGSQGCKQHKVAVAALVVGLDTEWVLDCRAAGLAECIVVGHMGQRSKHQPWNLSSLEYHQD